MSRETFACGAFLAPAVKYEVAVMTVGGQKGQAPAAQWHKEHTVAVAADCRDAGLMSVVQTAAAVECLDVPEEALPWVWAEEKAQGP